MPESQTTAWELIESAAAGDKESLQEFVTRYQELMRGWLRARWRGTDHKARIDDALQDALLECVKRGGALTRVDRSRTGGFRPFLQGVVRNVAARYQTRGARDRRRGDELLSPDQLPSPETTVSQALDQELARALVREAADAMAARATRLGASARLRVEILRLRFGDDLPIRDIATRLQIASQNEQNPTKKKQMSWEAARAYTSYLSFFKEPTQKKAMEEMLRPQLMIRSKHQFAFAENEGEGKEVKAVGLAYGMGWGLYTKTKYGKAFF